MTRKLELYTVRNAAGQFLGTYRAIDAKAAIQRFWDDQQTQASTFRGQAIKFDPSLTAEWFQSGETA